MRVSFWRFKRADFLALDQSRLLRYLQPPEALLISFVLKERLWHKELACSMKQEQASICGLSGGSFVVESVDPPWASNVGEMASAKQQVLVYGEAKHTKQDN